MIDSKAQAQVLNLFIMLSPGSFCLCKCFLIPAYTSNCSFYQSNHFFWYMNGTSLWYTPETNIKLYVSSIFNKNVWGKKQIFTFKSNFEGLSESGFSRPIVSDYLFITCSHLHSFTHVWCPS